MSFLSNLQNSANTSSIAGKAQIMLTTGNANNKIEMHAKNGMIMTGNGDQNIAVDITNDLAIDTGCHGKDYIIGNAGNAYINTYDCDDMVVLDCDNLDLDIGDGDDNVIVSARGSFNINGGNGNKTIMAETFNYSANDNYITLKNGNHIINAMGNNIGIAVGNGNQTIGTVGDGHRIVAGNGNHTIGMYGSDIRMSLGNGNHDIRSIDNWLTAGEFTTTYDSSMGLFNHNIGLATTLQDRTSVYNGNQLLGYAIRGVSNVDIETGVGNVQGLVTIGDGKFNVRISGGQKIDIQTGASGSLQGFQAGEFRGQNGYVIPNITNQ